MSEHLPGTGHDAPDHRDPVATEDPVAGEGAVSDAASHETLDEDGPAGAHGEVRSAMRRLDELGDRPVEEHPEVYEEVHSVLRRSLDDEGSTSP